jgi:hypothetical protein
MTKKEPIKSQLRIPADLHGRLIEATKESGRSMNAEIIQRLEETLVDDTRRTSRLLAQVIAEAREIETTVKDLEDEQSRISAPDWEPPHWLGKSKSRQEAESQYTELVTVLRGRLNQLHLCIGPLVNAVMERKPVPQNILLIALGRI